MIKKTKKKAILKHHQKQLCEASQFLILLRRSEYLTQEELSRLSGVPISTIRNIESNKLKNYTMLSVLRILKIFDVKLIDYLRQIN